MSREIKFRAWDHINTKMVYEFNDTYSVAMSSDGELHAYLFQADGVNDIKLIESTGLLDKNGKEIFSDDIVRWAWQVPRQIIYEENHGWHPYGIYNLDWWKDSCIVGNIYENPELINVRKK